MGQKINSETVKLSLFSLLVSLVAYGFGLTNYSLSVDSESPIYGDMSMSLGRWGTNLIRYHIFNGHIPYFTLLLGLVFFSFTAVALSRAFKLGTTQSYVFSALFLSFPQMAYQLIFTMQADVVPIGFFLAVVAVLLFLKSTKNVFSLRSIGYFTAASFTLMFVIACYQALVLIPAVVYLIIVLQRTYRDDFNFKEEFFRTIHFAALMLLGFGLYYVSTRILCPPVESGYLASYTSGEANNRFSDFFKLWFNQLKGKVYYGNLLFAAATLAAIATVIKYALERKLFVLRLVLLFFILLIPYSMSFFITNGYHPPRIYITSGIVFAFLIVQLLSKPMFVKAIVAFSILACLANIYFISKLFYSNYQIFNHDKEVARKIDTAIYLKYPDFNPKTTYVYFYGCLPNEEHERFRLPDSEVFGGSLFIWDNGNNYRIINFFSFNDIAYYKLVDNKEIMPAIQDSITPMPVWPNKESIKMINNVVVVKLGPSKGAPLPIEQ